MSKVKSLKKQLMAAVATTMAGAVALSSATYAWFAINNTVEATGMSFTTSVSNNLFITTKEVEVDSTDILADSDFGTTLVSTKSALLEPVSTINAKAKEFFYASTANVNGLGDTVSDNWIAYDATDLTAFDENYGTNGAKGYIDYVYDLKAINGSDDALALRLTDVEMLSNVTSDPQTAFRVGVFVNKASGNGNNTTAGTYSVEDNEATKYEDTSSTTDSPVNVTAASIFTVNGAKNFTPGVDTDYKAVSAGGVDSAMADVKYNAPINVKVAAHSTEYYKVIVRVWLEGEDTTCNNTTFADLNKGTWSMSTKWNLGVVSGDGAATAATNITMGMTAADPVSLSGYTVSSTDSEFVTINGVVYKPISSTATGAIAGLYVAEPTSSATAYRVYTLSNNNLNPTDVTNMYKDIPAIN